MDETAKPLLQLCRRRAILLRRALEAFKHVSDHIGYCNMAESRIDGVLQILGYIESEMKEEGDDGRDSD